MLSNTKKYVFDKRNNFIGYCVLAFDSFDKDDYPTKGFYLKGNIDYVFLPVKVIDKFVQVFAIMSLLHTFLNNVTIQTSFEFGYSFLNKPSNGFRYKVGGFYRNKLTSFVNFYGLNV